MTETAPTLDEWHKLYQAALRVKELAPWEWMDETDVFGVQNPETDELGFVSIMGSLGEHFAVAVYLGAQGLYGFWAFEEMGPDDSAEILFEIPHLQGSFQDRNVLTQKDRDQIKELGLKFRGRNEWPMFRSYRPGYFPWYLEAWEVRFLTVAMEQVAEVAVRFREDPSELTPPGSDDSYLVRVPRYGEQSQEWDDQIITVPPPEPEPLWIPMDVPVLEALKQMPLSPSHLEMDFYMFPTPVADQRGARPYFLYSLLIVDGGSGFVFGNELLQPEPSLESMWALIPVKVIHLLANVGIVPREIRVRSALLFQLLQLLAEELPFEVKLTKRMRRLDDAMEFMLRRFI